jgi:alpha-beta hydrolase superfamily lysophospholipase
MMNKLRTDDGLQLQWRQWLAPGVAHGTVVLVHGLGEHMMRYARTVQVINEWGWHVVGYTHRGHGVSDGPRGDIPHPEALLLDLSRVIATTRKAGAGRVILLGHSMGGLVAARFVAEGLQPTPAHWWRPVEGLVLSSPALDSGIGPIRRLTLRLLTRLMPHRALSNGLKSRWISRDRGVVRAYNDDRLIHDRITPMLARFIVDGGQFVLRQAPNWKLPTLLMWAGADKCVAPRGSARFAQAAPAGVLRAREFPALYHEIFNEPERIQVFEHLERWLADQVPASSRAQA